MTFVKKQSPRQSISDVLMSDLRPEHREWLGSKLWRLNHMYKIQDKRGQAIVFKLNRMQRDFFEKKASRNIILKSRQLGITTYEAVDMLDDVLFTKNFDALMLSYDQTSQLDIFDHKIGFAWENFPEKLKPLYEVESDRANKLKFNFGDGTFSSITVKTMGRSGTYQRLHISEFGKICRESMQKAQEIIRGTIPSVPFHGRVDIESTAEGEIGQFHDMFWEAWNRGEPTALTEYKAHFYNWTWDDDEISRVDILEVSSEFKEIQKLHNLTDQEISYYYLKWLSLNKNWDDLHQEYPTTPEEAFISSGEKLFDREKLKEFETKEGIKIGDWTYFEPYRSGHTYAIGADPSEGVGGDNAAAVIFDFTPLRPKVVATYKSKHCPPDMFAYELRNGGNQYGSALIAVERNNHGHATLLKLREVYNQSLIYREIREGRLKVRETDRFGWNTNASTKPKMIFDLVTAINEDMLDIPSKDLLFEMRTYDRIDLDQVDRKDEHLGHWDLLTAAAIGFQMKGHRVGRQIQVITSSSRSNVYSAI